MNRKNFLGMIGLTAAAPLLPKSKPAPLIAEKPLGIIRGAMEGEEIKRYGPLDPLNLNDLVCMADGGYARVVRINDDGSCQLRRLKL